MDPIFAVLQPSTWFNVGTRRRSYTNGISFSKGPIEKQGFECEPGGLTPGIEIQDLKKVYGKKTAVDGISLKMYHGQITALLGYLETL